MSMVPTHCLAYVLRCTLSGSQDLLFQLSRTCQSLNYFLSCVIKPRISVMHTFKQKERDPWETLFLIWRQLRFRKSRSNGLFCFVCLLHFLLSQPLGNTGVVWWQLYKDDSGSQAVSSPQSGRGKSSDERHCHFTKMSRIPFVFRLPLFCLECTHHSRKCLEEQEVRFLTRKQDREAPGRWKVLRGDHREEGDGQQFHNCVSTAGLTSKLHRQFGTHL